MTDALITKNFGSTWLEVERRLRADLQERGVPAETARDICQEVAERALYTEVSYTDVGDLLRWSLVVGRRLAIDHHRKQARLLIGDVPDRAVAIGPEDIVAARMTVGAISAALGTLTEDERSLLLDERTAPTRQERVHLAVRRHRVRQRLLAMLGWLGGVPIVRRLLRPSALAVLAPVLVTIVVLPLTGDANRPSAVPMRRVDVLQTMRPRNAAPLATVVMPMATHPTPMPSTTPSPLSPLDGRHVDPPGPTGRIHTRERNERDRVVCATVLPTLGRLCTPF
jgi:hypothetical protein